MKKKAYIGLSVWLVLSIVLLYLLPWTAYTYIKRYVSVSTLDDLFFATDLLYFIAVGIFAGKNHQKRWSLLIISYIIFVFGSLRFFYLHYPITLFNVTVAKSYNLAIGIFAMYKTNLVKDREKKAYIGLLVWLILSMVLLYLLPCVGFTFVTSDKGVGTLVGMFIVIYNIYFIAMGIFAGKNLRKMWGLPIISYIMFVDSQLKFFEQRIYDPFIIATDLACLTFFATGVFAMLVTALVTVLIKWETSLNPKEEAPSIDVK